MSKSSSLPSRRQFLLRTLQGSGILMLGGCEKLFDSLQQNEKFLSVLESVEGGNRRYQRFLTRKGKLAQEFSEKDISRTFKANGNPPPITMDYTADAATGWQSWRLEISGLVERPERLSLAELRALPARTQITRHDCVEGWSAVAKWQGVPLDEIIKRARPTAKAKYVVFHCMDTDSDGNYYYESLDFVDAVHPQTILAYAMNDGPLAIDHGAPLRLRVETQLGYKHAKYIRGLSFVPSVATIGQGKGGYWEDQGYEWYAGI